MTTVENGTDISEVKFFTCIYNKHDSRNDYVLIYRNALDGNLIYDNVFVRPAFSYKYALPHT